MPAADRPILLAFNAMFEGSVERLIMTGCSGLTPPRAPDQQTLLLDNIGAGFSLQLSR